MLGVGAYCLKWSTMETGSSIFERIYLCSREGGFKKHLYIFNSEYISTPPLSTSLTIESLRSYRDRTSACPAKCKKKGPKTSLPDRFRVDMTYSTTGAWEVEDGRFGGSNQGSLSEFEAQRHPCRHPDFVHKTAQVLQYWWRLGGIVNGFSKVRGHRFGSIK